MLDMTEVMETIKELENGTTTFDNCLKLACPNAAFSSSGPCLSFRYKSRL